MSSRPLLAASVAALIPLTACPKSTADLRNGASDTIEAPNPNVDPTVSTLLGDLAGCLRTAAKRADERGEPAAVTLNLDGKRANDAQTCFYGRPFEKEGDVLQACSFIVTLPDSTAYEVRTLFDYRMNPTDGNLSWETGHVSFSAPTDRFSAPKREIGQRWIDGQLETYATEDGLAVAKEINAACQSSL